MGTVPITSDAMNAMSIIFAIFAISALGVSARDVPGASCGTVSPGHRIKCCGDKLKHGIPDAWCGMSTGSVCDGDWSVNVPSCNPRNFAVEGCDDVYPEIIRQVFRNATFGGDSDAFPKSKCSLMRVVAKRSVCVAPDSPTIYSEQSACMRDGMYGFDAVVMARCVANGASVMRTMAIGVSGTMKNEMFTAGNINYDVIS